MAAFGNEPPVPPQPEEEPLYPPLTINPFPAPHPSTEILRQYVTRLIQQDQIDVAIQKDGAGFSKHSQQLLNQLHAVFDEREKLEEHLLPFSTLTITNYSEYSVLFEALTIPNGAKIWVHEATSPRSLECIKRKRGEEDCRRRILFASELTAEELAGDREELFNSKNPQYSSESSDVIEGDLGGSSSGYDSYDQMVEEMAAELARQK